jgi:hypothetical protein
LSPRAITGTCALNRQGQQEFRAAGVDVLGYGQDRTDVVGGMAQPAHGQIGVEQIGVTHQHRVEKRGLIHRSPPATDKCCAATAAELFGVLAERSDELTVQGPDGAGNAVQHVAFEHRPGPPGQVRRPRPDDEAPKIVHNVVT